MSFGGTPQTKLTGFITNDISFYPDLDKGTFQEDYRLPAEYTDSMISEALCFGMTEINIELQKHLIKWQIKGQQQLTTIQQRLYLRAVYCRAKAFLLKQFPTVTAKPSANNTGKSDAETYPEFLTLAGVALRKLQGRGRIGVEAI